MVRNLDNWHGALDHIRNQLFQYNYSDEYHLHILRLKYWVLDGEILEEEKNNGLKDEDIRNPKNHKESLNNELVFLDKYIRTKDKKLDKYEEPFATFFRSRVLNMKQFLLQKNPETSERNKEWEMPYSNRPSLLSTNDFDSIYRSYKTKESHGELSNAFEIISKISDFTIDDKKFLQEYSILNLKTPEEMYEDIKKNAILEKYKEDTNLVKEMNRAHEEILTIISKYEPAPPPAPEPDPGSGLPTPKPDPRNKIVMCNLPTLRVNVGETKNDPSHKGMIIEQLMEGGYRFDIKEKDLKSICEIPKMIPIQVNPNLYMEVEWDFKDWIYGYLKYPDIQPSTPDSGNSSNRSFFGYFSDSGTEQMGPIIISLNVSLNSLEENDKNRFIELNKRWKNLNEIRERQMANTGTRFQLEAMFNAEIPDMLKDMEKCFRDRKEEKDNLTNILKEICLFNEFK